MSAPSAKSVIRSPAKAENTNTSASSAPGQNIRAPRAVKTVGLPIADQRIPMTRPNEVFNPAEDIPLRMAAAAPACCKADRHSRIGPGVAGRVRARLAKHAIRPRAPGQKVVVSTAKELVIAFPAFQRVIAVIAVDPVVLRAALGAVMAVSGKDHIRPRPAVQNVIARTAAENVIAALTVNRVIPVAPYAKLFTPSSPVRLSSWLEPTMFSMLLKRIPFRIARRCPWPLPEGSP